MSSTKDNHRIALAQAPDDPSFFDETAPEHANLRRVPGRVPWFLFIICLVEVKYSQRLRQLIHASGMLTRNPCSLESASSTLKSLDHSKTISSDHIDLVPAYLGHLAKVNQLASPWVSYRIGQPRTYACKTMRRIRFASVSDVLS